MAQRKIKIYFLGTSGSTFTERDFPPCIYVEGFLFDCPAQCPKKLAEHGLLASLHTVLLTHLHMDHSLGVYDLAWHLGTTMSDRRLKLYLPAGGREIVSQGFKVLGGALSDRLLGFFEVVEVGDGFTDNGIKAVSTRHSVPAVGYRLDIGDVSICYTGDTAPSEKVVEAFSGCNVLIHDSTYPPGHEEQAARDGHSTPRQAAEVARLAKAQLLVLIHLPYARLGNRVGEEFLRAAKEIFPNVIVPEPGYVLELGDASWR